VITLPETGASIISPFSRTFGGERATCFRAHVLIRRDIFGRNAGEQAIRAFGYGVQSAAFVTIVKARRRLGQTALGESANSCRGQSTLRLGASPVIAVRCGLFKRRLTMLRPRRRTDESEFSNERTPPPRKNCYRQEIAANAPDFFSGEGCTRMTNARTWFQMTAHGSRALPESRFFDRPRSFVMELAALRLHLTLKMGSRCSRSRPT